MILDDEVQQVRGLGLNARVGRLAEDGLFQIAENGGKGIAALAPEQVRRLAPRRQIGLQPSDGGMRVARVEFTR
ncbi:hypothetical protein [Acidithiobacillus ferriphilus]|uniref:hypothetical protein n=1 Tax=Acidithiobacillus ferriphilus TaxID=1689834 RepID=UPI00242DBF24|nr:hypothetical protein [Acidithiobacillus ferriphilus]